MRIFIILLWSALAFGQGKPPASLVPEPYYREKFVRWVDSRSMADKALNLIGLTSRDVGKSFALIAGVSKYPNMPKGDRELPAAAADIEALENYLKNQEFFDEIVVLRDADVTSDNLEYFLQNYFPDRLRNSPKSRFLFAYSGHGMAEGSKDNPTGYLLKSTARSLQDKLNGINMTVLRVYLEQVVDAGYQTLALINACNSGAFFSRRPFGSTAGAATAGGIYFPKNGGAHAITAGGSNQLTWHDPKLGRGSVFFEKVLAGLGGQADMFPIYPDGHRGDGVITVDEIATYLREEVSLATNQAQIPIPADLALNRSLGGFFFLNRQRMIANGVVPEWPPRRGTSFGGPKVGDSKLNPKDGLTYMYIPPGTFRMGCSQGDGECDDDEKPAREVTLTKGFWLGQTEVTVEAYRRHTQATGKEMPPEPKFKDRALNPGWRNGKMPIVDVTWDEAKSYCEWTGGRLPTEAEWEYAARGGMSGARHGALGDVAWYGDNAGKSRIDTARIWASEQSKYGDRLFENENTFHGVGLKTPNAFGLYDMLGNVWEWVADWYGEKYYVSGETTDPQGPPKGEYRALRGGSWYYPPVNARVSFRVRDEPANRNDDFGFRCVGE